MGMDENVLRAYTQSESADILFQTEDSTPKTIPTISKEYTWTDRLILHAEIIESDIHIPIVLIGYNEKTQSSVFQSTHWLSSGKWPQNPPDIVMGKQLYALLENPKQPTIALFSETIGHNARIMNTSGILQTHNPKFDNNSIWLPNSILEQFSGYNNQRTHILFRNKAPQPSSEWISQTAKELASPMLTINSVRKSVLLCIYSIIMLISIIGMISTTLVTMEERKKEFALLRAMGCSRKDILRLILIEQSILSVLYISLGALFGTLFNMYYHQHGFDLSAQSSTLGSLSVSLILYTHFSWSWIMASMVLTYALATIPNSFFIWQQSNIQPAELIRAPQ